MQNDDWFVIALDTDYHADEIRLYQDGNLDLRQLKFLDDLLASSTKKRRTILFTHHNGLSVDGAPSTALWGQIQPRFANRELWWYWRHAHAGVVYSDRITVPGRGNAIYPHSCGHGAIPAGAPDSLVSNPAAVWHETSKASALLYPERVRNGFAMLDLNGRELNETFVNEDGTKVFTRILPLGNTQ